MSYPKDVTRFLAWSKAMVAGATVDKPNYGKTLSGPKKSRRRRKGRKRFLRRKRKKED